MKTDTKDRLLEFIKENAQTSPVELQKHLQITPQALHRHLKALLEQGLLKRVGSPPRVYYLLRQAPARPLTPTLPKEDLDFLEERYVYVSPQGNILKGLEAFREWADNTQQSKFLSPLVREFIKVRKQSDEFFQKNRLINATEKFRKTFPHSALNEVFYSDFYSLPKFGKTPLGSLVLYAKQAQDRKLIAKIAEKCAKDISKLIGEKK